MSITKLEALLSLRPNPDSVWRGNESEDYPYSGLEWKDSRTKPTEAELDAEVTRLQTEYNNYKYQRDRAAEYPSVVDQLDDIYHNGIDAWKATIKTTKDKYPKP